MSTESSMEAISPKKLRNKPGAKIGALTLACFLWIYVALNGTFNTEIKGSIEVMNLQPGWTLASPLPETVIVNLTGKGWDLLWIRIFWKSDLKFNIDLEAKTYNFNILTRDFVDWVTLPRRFEDGISVNSIVYPDTISVVLDNVVSRLLPVSDKNIQRSTREGYIQVGKTEFEPDSVTITGPGRVVMTMQEVLTVPKTFENKNKDYSDLIELENPHLGIVKYSAGNVKMSIDVQLIGENQIGNIPVRAVRVPLNYEVDFRPSIVTVYVKGGNDYIKELIIDDFIATVMFDENWVKGGEYFALVNLQFPEHIISSELTPKNITVIVK